MMKLSTRAVLVTLAISASGMILSACTSDPDLDITKLGVQTDPPDVLYNQGLANINAGKLTEAQRKFDAIDKQHPFSEWARKALVMATFVKYRQGDNEAAIQSGERYMNLYAQTKDAAYVQYMIGLAYAKQIPVVTQDQRASAKTIEAMMKVVNNYPTSEYVDDAQVKIRMARDNLAGKEMQIGRYYQERKEYLAAVSRYRNVVESFSNTNQVEEALARLVECYFALGLSDEAQTAAAVLGHNYPDSDWYKDSFALLKTQGLEPRENTGSWISRAGKKLLLGEST
ncbi:outer membrane protein assembly factor BamD [Rhizobium sp. SG_E_25_P2]|uniref:outer membrane protein assembly factor BamD n=1 Tax=Rhizobium sp. SG_E_25_P2 TaxID=2879942 RepID=UPI0024766409|nr:outer membrane protein assembly factor BamD [Rhizobium sp. SG_E_25_P2]MDH6267916.1 outer membrane protein assembly factor BamD [Rhizobium sp. SG_E_25_P2]